MHEFVPVDDRRLRDREMKRDAADRSRRASARRAHGCVLVLLCATCFVSRVHAAPYCEPYGKRCPEAINAESARGLALGTGQRAASMSTSALAYNPAALVAGRVYHIEGLVDYMADLKTVALGGAVVDSSTSALGAGLSLRGFLSGDSGLGGIDGRLALALPISDAISIGVAGRYLNVTGEVDTPSGTSREHLAKGFTMDASLRFAPIPEVQLDIATYNFINRESSYAPIMFGGGAAFALADVAVVGADLLVDFNSFNKSDFLIGGGIEVFAGATVPLRVGYSYDTQRRQNTISFGLGYTDTSVGVDVALRQDLGGLGDTRLMLAVRFYIH